MHALRCFFERRKKRFRLCASDEARKLSHELGQAVAAVRNGHQQGPRADELVEDVAALLMKPHDLCFEQRRGVVAQLALLVEQPGDFGQAAPRLLVLAHDEQLRQVIDFVMPAPPRAVLGVEDARAALAVVAGALDVAPLQPHKLLDLRYLPCPLRFGRAHAQPPSG